MTPNTDAIQAQIEVVRRELTELESTLPEWETMAGGIDGSRKYRAITKRILQSVKHLEESVRENTFQRP